jgi:acyl-CoA dehydrogenase
LPWSAGINGHNGHQWISPNQIHDIFEGTEQIQQLVISRAISGLRIE